MKFYIQIYPSINTVAHFFKIIRWECYKKKSHWLSRRAHELPDGRPVTVALAVARSNFKFLTRPAGITRSTCPRPAGGPEADDPTRRITTVTVWHTIWNPDTLISRHILAYTVIWRYRVVYEGIWRVHTNNASIKFSYLGIIFWCLNMPAYTTHANYMICWTQM